MKTFRLLFLVFVSFFSFNQLNAQGAISSLNNSVENNSPTCGSYDLLQSLDKQNEGFLKMNDQLMEQLIEIIKLKKKEKTNVIKYTIPIVFHIVHNNSQENLPDSVILNQVRLINEAFRRQNADTINTRTEFKGLVGDSKIEFKLANTDPSGASSNGITRTNTNVQYFGGILPYGPGQNQAISNWVSDSLYINFFRITESVKGGKDAWDTDKYLNVWIGDLRLFEPQFNDFEELVFFALATPPIDHINWPGSLLSQINTFDQGVLIHYVAVGSNNANSFPFPYNNFNNPIKSGKILVHEIGHYLGLRHIWGDGDCSADDYIQDTPNSTTSSSWDCNKTANFCIDTISNTDLPNMVENYMDYSSGDCQNSFTKGQIELMRTTLNTYRPAVFDSITSIHELNNPFEIAFDCYPNPSDGDLKIRIGEVQNNVQINVQNSIGQLVMRDSYLNTNQVDLNLDFPSGIYYLQLMGDRGRSKSIKIVLNK